MIKDFKDCTKKVYISSIIPERNEKTITIETDIDKDMIGIRDNGQYFVRFERKVKLNKHND